MERLFYTIRGKFRMFWGFCPNCNSDAPELYDCPICEYNKVHKTWWWARYKNSILIKM